jgi:hypothetical protein
LDETLYRGDATEGDLDAVTFNSIASTILKWLGFKVLRWMQYYTIQPCSTKGWD